MTIGAKIDTILKSSRIMEMRVREVFLSEKDYKKLFNEEVKDPDLIKESQFKGVTGIIKISKLE